jgi:hypothetical protein
VNTHLQLLRNSVFAPKAPVDLAKQHPNTTKLGCIYLAASIVAGVAVSFLITLQQNVMSELTQRSTGAVLFVLFVVQMGVFIGFSSVYFSHATQMSLGKPFVLNLHFFVLVVFASLLLHFLLLVLISVLTGTSLAAIFAKEELVQ